MVLGRERDQARQLRARLRTINQIETNQNIISRGASVNARVFFPSGHHEDDECPSGTETLHYTASHNILPGGEVSQGEKMLYSGTKPESYITEYTLVYQDNGPCQPEPQVNWVPWGRPPRKLKPSPVT